MGIVLPTWCKSAKKAMIEQDITCKQLSEDLGLSRPYVSQILNGRVYSPKAVKKISDYLNIPDSDGITIRRA